MNTKRAKGQYYTLGNPFTLQPFVEWAQKAGLPETNILEPFAGANNIIRSLQDLSLCNDFCSFDITPNDKAVQYRDTIKSFPKGYSICVTNPPWLAKNSSKRRGLPYPNTLHDDLYKHCLELCLANCEFVAALVPASYLQSGLFRQRLHSYILLHDRGMFNDTDNPVCLSLFNKEYTDDVKIYYDSDFVDTLTNIENKIPRPTRNRNVTFNDPLGELGFISFDNIREPSIRFCEVDEIREYPIKISSRFITRISGDFSDVSSLITDLNEQIAAFRNETKDLLLTTFKGIRMDGYYRRRMSFALARRFINAC